MMQKRHTKFEERLRKLRVASEELDKVVRMIGLCCPSCSHGVLISTTIGHHSHVNIYHAYAVCVLCADHGNAHAETKNQQEIRENTRDIDVKIDGVSAGLEAVRAVLDEIQGKILLRFFLP